jgi:GNAT superfamily N-acetyltransferase
MPITEIHPLTTGRWDDFENLFGPRGACGGCWCMYWKLTRKDFEAGTGNTNRLAQKAVVDGGHVPGLIAYVDGTPAGWVAIEPRQNYPTLGRSRILKPLDEEPVWSITCFFVDRQHRGTGLTIQLLKAAVEHVKSKNGKIVEGYPVEPKDNSKMPPVFVYTGLVSAFTQAGFVEAERRSATRPIMRYYIK